MRKRVDRGLPEIFVAGESIPRRDTFFHLCYLSRIQFLTPGFNIGIDDKHPQRKRMQDEATSVKIRERECNDQVLVNMEKVAALVVAAYLLALLGGNTPFIFRF
uniref:Uncharacterized protein n=1 Tax=Tanacetum cinerariifolium TaxID=118510 RepID=A0A6L2JZP9_TANCI|nr:hypothetical protein [Tanacetum cinerariifolium]